MSDEIKSEGVDLADLSEPVSVEPDAPQAETPDETAASVPEPADAAVMAADIPSNPEPVEDDEPSQVVSELEAVFDVPVGVAAVLGRTNIEVSSLLALNEGDVVELDRKVGEAIDIFINNRLIARGEVVLVEDRLGVTMTEIIKGDQAN